MLYYNTKAEQGLDMTLVKVANAHTEELAQVDAEKKQRELHRWLAVRFLVGIPCAAFAFAHIDVFLRDWRNILEAGGVLLCLLAIASTIHEYGERRDG